ncbi:hypothetical protein CEUSTIGMA_g10249.t1 [Chlamydomonas eustigma]|uniref:Uncharacterized protein n=1 Tax=Chlamydomonas eustigma TaxID=1157962 RepID=A0A250XIF5_9CHLO|nr:hypothetical protein CEUSTIGMA_g10249.t1 [Chlamydomonas eustigma]|eukprot:GAX82823.1 hypothetical protein CEUSTIGMA_g10249.t1 [Chlamydomonas eustigma]
MHSTPNLRAGCHSSISTPRLRVHSTISIRCAVSNLAQSNIGTSVTSTSGRNSRVETTYGGILIHKLVSGSKDVDSVLFGLSPQECRRLTARLKQAATYSDVRRLLPAQHAEWIGVDTVCLTASLSALARVASKGAGGKGNRLSTPDKLEILKHVNLLIHLTKPRLAELDVQGLAAVAVSIAKLQQECMASDSTCTASCSYIDGTADDSHADSETELSGASLCALFNDLLHFSTFVLDRFSPQGLANLIWAVATVGYQPSGKWLTEYYRQVDSVLPQLQSRDVANILWSLCKSDLMPDIWLRDGLVERALDAIKESSGKQSGQDPATLIQCLARWYYLYNYRVPDEWLTEYLSIVQPSLGSYLPSDLVSLLHSCVVMNYQPSRPWMTDYYTNIMRSLKYEPPISYSDFQRLFWALSRVDYTPPLQWQRVFVNLSIPKVKHLKIRALSELIWTLACWSCRPSPEWLAVFFTVSHPQLRDAKPHHISCILSALQKLECAAPSPWLDEAMASFRNQKQDAKAHDLVTMLDTITTVCGDRVWLHRHTSTIKELANTAASKFAVYDAVMHTKLCMALAAANVCPASDWLSRQQAALLACIRGGDSVGQGLAQDLRGVYKEWDVEVEAELQHLL